VSIPRNIAEGYGRHSSKDYVRFLQISRGSLYELQTQAEICLRLGYLTGKNHSEICAVGLEIERMLNALIQRIANS